MNIKRPPSKYGSNSTFKIRKPPLKKQSKLKINIPPNLNIITQGLNKKQKIMVPINKSKPLSNIVDIKLPTLTQLSNPISQLSMESIILNKIDTESNNKIKFILPIPEIDESTPKKLITEIINKDESTPKKLIIEIINKDESLDNNESTDNNKSTDNNELTDLEKIILNPINNQEFDNVELVSDSSSPSPSPVPSGTSTNSEYDNIDDLFEELDYKTQST